MTTMQEPKLFFDYELVEVTPEMARKWLDAMPGNRKARPGVAAHYAEMIRSGQWKPLPSMPLMFDWGGLLRDGQHRLLAVLEVGRPVWMYVRRNVDESELLAIHDTLPRLLSDQITIAHSIGPTRARYAASIGRLVWERIRLGYLSPVQDGNSRIGLHEITESFASIGIDGWDLACKADRIYSLVPNGMRLFSASEIGYALAQGPSGIEEWLIRLVTDGNGKTPGMLAARHYQANSGERKRLRRSGHLAIATAWNNPTHRRIQAPRKSDRSPMVVPDLEGGVFCTPDFSGGAR